MHSPVSATPAARRWIGQAGALALACALTAGAADDQDPTPPQTSSAPVPLRLPTLLPDEESLNLVRIDPACRALIRQLDDSSFAVREAAMAALVETSPEIPQLCRMLADETLSPEQRYRLLAVLQEQIIQRPRGALGIRMQVAPRRPGARGGIEVTELLPGMPAERVLALRDRITHIDGYLVRTQDDLAILIQSKRPGESVNLKIDRPRRDERGARLRDEDGSFVYDEVETQLQLGSVEQLVDPDTGLTAVSPTVMQGRMRQVQEASGRYGPRARPLRLADGQSVAFASSKRPRIPTQRPVDGHPAVQSVLMQRQLIAEGHLQLTETLRGAWREHLRLVILEADEPGLDEARRRYLQRVALRLAELINQ